MNALNFLFQSLVDKTVLLYGGQTFERAAGYADCVERATPAWICYGEGLDGYRIIKYLKHPVLSGR